MSKAPSPPDPYAVSAAQTQSNQQTAAYNAQLNRVSTYTPYGNLVYSQTQPENSGTVTGYDPNTGMPTYGGYGGTGAPQYRADISLAPEAQKQLDNQLAQNDQLSNLGFGLANKAQGSLGMPVGQGIPDLRGAPGGTAFQTGVNPTNLQGSLDTSGVSKLPNANDFAEQVKRAQDASYGKQTAYLDPQFNNAQNDLEAKLANQGIVQGSDAYSRAQGDLGRQKEFAYGQARDSSVALGDALQNQLFGQGVAGNQAGMGNAVAQGSFANQAAQQQFGQNLSNAGLYNDAAGQTWNQALQGGAFQDQARAQALQEQTNLASLPLNQLNALRSGTQIQNPTFQNAPQANANPTDVSGNVWNGYNAQVANSNNFMNGLFGLGSAAIGAIPFSDRRLKRNISRVGETPAMKLPLYAFDYVWGGRHVGVMAQDVAKVLPAAVRFDPSGYMAVDYGMLS